MKKREREEDRRWGKGRKTGGGGNHFSDVSVRDEWVVVKRRFEELQSGECLHG